MARRAQAVEQADGVATAEPRRADAVTRPSEERSDGGDRATIRVRGRSSAGPTAPDNIRYGHWRAGHHWPGDQIAEVDVTLEELDELKADPWLALTYDAAEEELVRARTAPDRVARQSALDAAEAELRAAELSAKAISDAAQRAALEATRRAEAALQRIEALRRGDDDGDATA